MTLFVFTIGFGLGTVAGVLLCWWLAVQHPDEDE